jgi:hypothetical protein
MDEGLENSDAVFRSISLVTKRRERIAVRSAICEVKLAVGIEALILRVCQTPPGAYQHTNELAP